MANEPRDSPTTFRRGLRQKATPAERRFWTLSRDRRLAGIKFRRQHSIGAYVVDFYCHAASVAVELDGSVHDDPMRALYDTERQRVIEGSGVRVLRFSNEDVFEQPEYVVAVVVEAVRERMRLPKP